MPQASTAQSSARSRADSARLDTHRRAPEQKREALARAAARLFVEQGFDKTSTLQIAREAGVSEGILFHHFGSKRGLLNSLAQDFARTAAEVTMPANPEAMTEDFVVRSAFDFAEQNPGLYDLLVDNASLLDEFSHSKIIIATICRNLKLGMQNGRVRKGHADIMAELQFAVVDGAYKAWRSSGQPERREAFITEAITSMQAMLNPITTSPQERAR